MKMEGNVPEATSNAARSPVLEVLGLYAGYGDLAAVRDLSLVVYPGEIVALLGPNGAGKTTTLLTLCGAIPALGGKVLWCGEVTTEPLYRRIRKGMGFISEERSVTNKLTVKENLALGSGPVEDAFSLFPQLRRLQNRQAGLLSGGEQQMVTLARCLSSKPSLMLVDELSLGLAPIVVETLFSALRNAAVETGTAVLLVEQQVQRALTIADRWYLLRHGSLVNAGAAGEDSFAELSRAYL
jgi:branched-chain amino acid transport system ATP-binding protein